MVGLVFFYGYLLYRNIGLLKDRWKRPSKTGEAKKPDVTKALVLLAAMLPAAGWAQTADGATGINQANTMVRSYFDPAVNLMYAVGAIAGLIGAVKVYRAMSGRDHDSDNRAAAWFAGCIFLVVVATVLRSFFGL
jgi:hypothetical protein